MDANAAIAGTSLAPRTLLQEDRRRGCLATEQCDSTTQLEGYRAQNVKSFVPHPASLQLYDTVNAPPRRGVSPRRPGGCSRSRSLVLSFGRSGPLGSELPSVGRLKDPMLS